MDDNVLIGIAIFLMFVVIFLFCKDTEAFGNFKKLG